MKSINPASGEIIQDYREHSVQEVDERIERAHEAYLSWRETSFDPRAARMMEVASLLRDRKRKLAGLMAHEMGKPITQGESEAEKCAWVCEYYAQNAKRFLERQPIETDASESFVAFAPLGVVLAVMPWNFPFWQVFRFAAPALMAGNGVVLKHAANVPACALAIEELLCETGFPKHLFAALLVSSKQVDHVLEHPKIAAATLTGSVTAGRAVARKAGEMLKKTVLELGGSDAYVVLEDADLDETVATCVKSRLINSGQSCIAAKRFIVVESVRERFENMFTEHMRAAKMGDPMDESTDIGPLARADLRDQLHEQVRESVSKGAKLLLGGEVLKGPGAYYPPTVLSDVAPGMPAYEEELFGPVAAIIPVENEQEALRCANDSDFGLGAAVFTGDVAKGKRIAAERLEAGVCFVNDFVKSDPRLPFGGVKQSGYGRELSIFGIREFVNIKTVYVSER